jgi:hypothetical protein
LQQEAIILLTLSGGIQAANSLLISIICSQIVAEGLCLRQGCIGACWQFSTVSPLPCRVIGARLGRVDIHLSHIMAPTKNSIDTYDSAVFS